MLDRLSYLRQSTSFLNSSLHSPLARFILFHDLKPLAFLPSDASSGAPAELATVGWEKVKEIIGEEADGFGFGEDGQVKTNGVSGSLSAEAGTEGTDLKPILIFLGVEETTGDESSSTEPKDLSKTTDRIPTGTRPYFALEVTHLPSDVRDHIVSTFEIAAGKSNDGKPAFHDLRSLPIPLESTPADAAAEARAVIDWNRRNQFCPGCGRQTASVWAGWKRMCMPNPDDSAEKKSPCISRKGLHNFNYPRTDPVTIMAILDPTGESILMGRQKAWPPKLYSCLAGFVEPGETIEQAVRREVWEESGLRVKTVRYHSSRTWPYPSSLMIGCFGQMEGASVIRTDLDNELEDAHFFPRSAILAALNSSSKSDFNFSTQEPENPESRAVKSKETGSQYPLDMKLPPKTTIAHVLIEAWARGEFTMDG